LQDALECQDALPVGSSEGQPRYWIPWNQVDVTEQIADLFGQLCGMGWGIVLALQQHILK
jgi:hypothetical protein